MKAFIEDNGEKKPFHLCISEPIQAVGEASFYCRIHAPELLRKDTDIYGADEDQAKNLAFEFVQSMLGHRRLVNGKGEAISPLEAFRGT